MGEIIMGKLVTLETIGSLKKYIKSANSKFASVEIYRYKSIDFQFGFDSKDLVFFDEFELDGLPDKMPCVYEFMDDDEYKETIDNHMDHVPFPEYLEGENPLILVVVLPYEWEDYLDYYTICASTGAVDDYEYNPMGDYYGNDEQGKPLFDVLDNVEGKQLQKYSTLSEAEKVQHKIVSSLQTTIEYNQEIYVAVVHHYREVGEWYTEVKEDEAVTYQWKDITGAYAVTWSWETHVGYCRKFHNIFQVSKSDACHDDSLLVEIDNTYVPQTSLLFTAEEVKNMEAEGTLTENLKKELLADRWKWQNVGAVKSALS